MKVGGVTQAYLKPARTGWYYVALSCAQASTVIAMVGFRISGGVMGDFLTTYVQLSPCGGVGFQSAAVRIAYQGPVRSGVGGALLT
jgi:hypothetical protein